MVIPYNGFSLKKYKCHINVEYCATVNSIKYIFDYIHKGSDRAYCSLNKNDSEVHDEIKSYIDGRYISPMEAAWRLNGFNLVGRSHKIVRLAVHTENQQNLIFKENKEEEEA